MEQMKYMRHQQFRWVYAVTVFFLLLACGMSPETAGAQWNTSGNDISTTNTGNVGIGTTTPHGKLDVVGMSGAPIFSTGLSGVLRVGAASEHIEFGYVTGSRTWIQGFGSVPLYINEGGNNVIFNLAGGNVGIGTATPANQFHVHNGYGLASMRISGAGLGALNFIDSSAPLNSKLFQWRSEGGLFRMSLVNDNENAYVQPNLLVANASGNIGIGGNSLGSKLGINGTNAVDGGAKYLIQAYDDSVMAAGVGGGIVFTGNYLGANSVNFAGIQGFKENGTSGDYAGALMFTTRAHGGSMTERLRINSAGNVGIGTAAPATKLDVAGQVKSSSGGFVFPDGTVQTTAATGSGSIAASNVTQGQFGAGNYIFPGNVDISGNLTWGNSNTRTDWKHDAGAIASRSGFFETNNPVNYPTGASGWWHLIESRHSNNSNNYALQIAGSFMNQDLYTRKIHDNGGRPWSKFVLQGENGNVNVGTSASSTLTVEGNIDVKGNINAKYQDVAEWVESSQKLEAGTVVALDPEKSNQVIASSEAYDTRVAGVISAQPGISLGERGEGKVLVATTGRVKVKVDARRAPIKIGDLLVTSDVAGVAMKSEPISISGRRMHAPGTLIGKALEPLAKGTGEILVLLSLQ